MTQTDPSSQRPARRYLVNLTTPGEMRDTHPSVSWGSGRHAHTVYAPDMPAAIAVAVRRARDDGYYGRDWLAKIVPLSATGHRESGAFGLAEVCLALRDDLDGPAFSDMRALAGGPGSPQLGGGVVYL